MADYGVTDTGFVRKPESVITSDLQDAMQAQFGQDLDIDTESPEGYIISTVADVANSLWELAEHCYNAFNPSAATGLTLDNVIKINDVTRKTATSSTVTVTFSGTDGTVIPEGTTLSSDASLTDSTTYKFDTEEEVTIASGTAEVLAIAQETGSTQVPIGSITIIDSPISGVDSVTNSEIGNVGIDDETDAELRARRLLEIALPSVSTTDSIRAGVLDIDTVSSAYVYQNNTALESTVNGVVLAPHSIKLIVQGGETDEENALIANEIFVRKDPGIQTTGDTSYDVTDSQGFTHTLYWDTPTLVPFYIQIDTDADSTDFTPDDEDDIRDAIISYIEDPDTGYLIGDNVSFSRLFTPINSISGHTVQSLTIGFDTGSMDMADLEIDGASLAYISDQANDIVINTTY